LVFECTESYNWYKRFEGAEINGEPIVVEQAAWQDVSLTSYPNDCVVTLRRALKPLPNTTQNQNRTVVVDFIFLRSVSRGIGNQDSRQLLLGLIHQNLPSVNSLTSAFLCTERSTTFAALKEIQKKLGKDDFPLIPQTYYASHREMSISPEFPIICKIGHAQSGYGKMKITNSSDFSDFRSVVGLHTDYVTAEPFIEWDWDGRVQKIGSHYRAFSRVSPHWKGNVGNQSVVTEIEPTEQMIRWADACSNALGGLDILGLDFVHSKADGKFYILELNDTAIGLVHSVADEDMNYMRDLVLTRMQEHFYPKEIDDNLDLADRLNKANDKIAQMERQLERERQARLEAEKEIEELKLGPPKKGFFSFMGW